MSRLPGFHVSLLVLVSLFALLPVRVDAAAVTVTINRKAPIETLSPSGDVTGVTEAVAGTSYTLVSVQGAQVMLQDAQGTHYLVAINCTDYVPPAAPAPAAPPAVTAMPPPASGLNNGPTNSTTIPPGSNEAVPPSPPKKSVSSTPFSAEEPQLVHVGGRPDNDQMAIWPPGGMAGRPLLVAAHGHGGWGPGEARSWIPLAQQYRFTVVCPTFRPVTDTNNLEQDGPYFDHCIQWIQTHLQYDHENVFMTGFSGGGHALWSFGTTKPDFFKGLFLQSCNFVAAAYVPDIGKWTNRPIKLIWGEKDLKRVIDQNQLAIAMLKAHHIDYTTEVVPGAGHQPHHDLVVAWMEKVMAPAADSSGSSSGPSSDDPN